MSLYYGQIVIGPAGSGKEMGQMLKRNILVINLDPAAEQFSYKCDIDIRELITLEDVMDEYELGPNGGLVYCIEYLMQNLDWLQEKINEIATDDYVLFDCPGQIELYTHIDLMRKFCKTLQNLGFSICSVYMLDVNFINDDAKYLSGILMALSAQMTLELPHFTILSKCDLVQNKKTLKRYLKLHKFNEENEFDIETEFDKSFRGFTVQINNLINQFGLIKLLPLDLSDEDTIQTVLQEIDYAIQWGENVEPDDKVYDQVEHQQLTNQFQDLNM